MVRVRSVYGYLRRLYFEDRKEYSVLEIVRGQQLRWGRYTVVRFGPLDLISRLGVAFGEPRPSISYIDRSGALRVLNNFDMTDRQTVSFF